MITYFDFDVLFFFFFAMVTYFDFVFLLLGNVISIDDDAIILILI